MRPWIFAAFRAFPAALLGLVLMSVVLIGCSPTPTPTLPPTVTPLPTATATPDATPTPALSATPTPIPQELSVCVTESRTANPFAPSTASNDLLALFYEEPVERVGYRWVPRLVERIPTFAEGDVATTTTTVGAGARYVGVDGAIKVYTGEEKLLLPQIIVTFTLQADLRWSDGEPLTVDDVVLGYHLAQSEEAYGRWRDLVERTAHFGVVGPRQLRWEGLPGYLSADYPGFLFPPQPAHRWSGQTLGSILQDRTPPGTGPFQIVAWETGREVRLTPNPHYNGAAPRLAALTVRFPQIQASGWGELLRSGECDVLLPDPIMQTEWAQWATLADYGEARLWADPAPVVLRLDFNVAPAGKQPTPLTNAQTRVGIAHCIDRGRLSEALPGEALLAADSYIPPGHPAYDIQSVWRIPFNADIGQSILSEVGWRDEDGDGIREAHAIEGFKDGTPLSLTLHLAPQYFVSAAHISADLDMCGVGVHPQPTEPQLLYASDAVSPLFGRTFEMVLFGWRTELPQVCGSWLSERIPSLENAWVGENFSGYTSEEYDAACRRALTAVDTASQWAALQEAQYILTADLPTLFLTWRPFWLVAAPKVQGLQPDASTYGTLWNSEEIFIGE